MEIGGHLVFSVAVVYLVDSVAVVVENREEFVLLQICGMNESRILR